MKGVAGEGGTNFVFQFVLHAFRADDVDMTVRDSGLFRCSERHFAATEIFVTLTIDQQGTLRAVVEGVA